MVSIDCAGLVEFIAELEEAHEASSDGGICLDAEETEQVIQGLKGLVQVAEAAELGELSDDPDDDPDSDGL